MRMRVVASRVMMENQSLPLDADADADVDADKNN
jgi:hypothetical protein